MSVLLIELRGDKEVGVGGLKKTIKRSWPLTLVPKTHPHIHSVKYSK